MPKPKSQATCPTCGIIIVTAALARKMVIGEEEDAETVEEAVFAQARDAEAASEEYLVNDGWKPVEVKPEAALVNGNDHHANGALEAAVTRSFLSAWGRSSDNRGCPSAPGGTRRGCPQRGWRSPKTLAVRRLLGPKPVFLSGSLYKGTSQRKVRSTVRSGPPLP